MMALQVQGLLQSCWCYKCLQFLCIWHAGETPPPQTTIWLHAATCTFYGGAHVYHCCYVLLRVLLHLIRKNWNDFLSENRYQLTDLCTFPYPHQIHRYSQHQYCTDSTDNSIVNRQRTFCSHRDMCNLMGWFSVIKTQNRDSKIHD